MPARPFALLDRDGTLIVDKVYLSDPAGIEFLPGVIEGLQSLRDAGFGLIIVTNQSGIGRGYFDFSVLDAIHARLSSLLAGEGIALDGIYVCPHGPEEGCDCRKPGTGLIRQAIHGHAIDLSRSVVIGDSTADVGAARAAGIYAIQLVPGPAAAAPGAHATAERFDLAAAIAIEHLANGDALTCT